MGLPTVPAEVTMNTILISDARTQLQGSKVVLTFRRLKAEDISDQLFHQNCISEGWRTTLPGLSKETVVPA